MRVPLSPPPRRHLIQKTVLPYVLNSHLTLSDGKLLIVATEPRKNLILLEQTFSVDFVSTVVVTMQVTKNNWVGLYYWIAEQNYLVVGVHGGDLEAHRSDEGR
jgi:hypothetical protein